MDLSRRSVLRSALALAGAAALFPSLAESAVAGTTARTTLAVTYVPGPPDANGYRKVVAQLGEPRVVRTDVGPAAAADRAANRKPLLAFAQLSDVHVVDHQSPARVEWTDRYDDPNQARAGGQQVADQGRRRWQVLEVVQ